MIPVALFVFNRPLHTQKTLAALAANIHASETSLYIFADGPRQAGEQPQTEAVRKICRDIQGFKSVELIERSNNMGLAQNIISGVGQIITQWGKVIVLEDDLSTSPGFLKYMNDGL
ncbi:MAG: sugar transferase, partial [Breznakibacter sp.]